MKSGEWSFRPVVSVALFCVALVVLTGCSPGSSLPAEQEARALFPAPVDLEPGEKLRVIATTSIVRDVVANVGRDLLDLVLLIPTGSDPHSFEPIPQDVAAVAGSHVLFANGVGLEGFLEPLLESAGASRRVVELSTGIRLLDAGEDGDQPAEGTLRDPGMDPHTWTDPNNVMVWVENTERTLSALDPGNAEAYRTNAQAYQARLEELDRWVRGQVAQIPVAQRLLVTDHLLFGYLAHQYGFTQVGAIIPAYTSLAQPSAKELAELEDAIRDAGVKAVFVGHEVNANLAETVARDTGTQLAFLHTGSLTEKGGDADTYLDYVRYNVSTIVAALK
jgi:ABC-type Zn uptake system ZnuABC Zn-binding protein ZnuA